MRPIWSGAVSFGLVTIPVRLYPATTNHRPKFRQLRREDHSRIRYRKVAEADGEEVPSKDIVRGYSYYLEPESTGLKAYSILLQALADKGRIGIAKVALRARVHLAALRARDDVLVLETMYWPDEIREAHFESLDRELEVRGSEVAMAEMLIDNLTSGFDPANWTDATRERIEELARQKIEGEEIVAPETPEPTKVVDLLEALAASVEATKMQAARRKAG